ncbi:MAG TPA: class III extradiol dioxygenase family protein [Steroidobacteraceae bacterium]|nr:class III extradiol dioxygenase family protein [Steroidobacteraceae bacterium]
MAEIVGCLMTSHVPAIGSAIARSAQQDPYWKPFFDGFKAVHAWLERARPDVVVMFYNDHGLNFFLDKMPTFAIGAAPVYHNADEGWGLPVLPPFRGDSILSWHLIEHLVDANFDMTTCQEMLLDHAFVVPMELLWPQGAWPVRVVPIAINTVQHPLPSAARCHALGQAVGQAIKSFPQEARVLILGTGGLSHQLDGQRAGFINKDFDLMCMDRLVNDPAALTTYTNRELVEQAGTQGVEILMWIAARGALPGRARKVHSNYHVPISNTAAGLLLLESVDAKARLRAA